MSYSWICPNEVRTINLSKLPFTEFWTGWVTCAPSHNISLVDVLLSESFRGLATITSLRQYLLLIVLWTYHSLQNLEYWVTKLTNMLRRDISWWLGNTHCNDNGCCLYIIPFQKKMGKLKTLVDEIKVSKMQTLKSIIAV